MIDFCVILTIGAIALSYKIFRAFRKRKRKIFLICPVRNITEEERERMKQYIKNIEKQGHKVHWPPRDTNQDDPIGLRICTDNAEAIIEADEIHVWWNPDSKGSLFDLGMAFILDVLHGKKIILANPDEVDSANKKSFNNVLLALHKKNTETRQKKNRNS